MCEPLGQSRTVSPNPFHKAAHAGASTAEQKSTIVEKLKKNKECSVPIHLLTNDIVSDGASYAANFKSVFEEAGWYATRVTPHPDDRDYESGVWIVGKGEVNHLQSIYWKFSLRKQKLMPRQRTLITRILS